jgi:predicted RNase H-like HicB family nuclease
MKYLVVIEKAGNNYSAYLPDLPGCAATGETPEDTMRNISKAIEMHLRGLKEDGLPLPVPAAMAEYLALQEAS